MVQLILTVRDTRRGPGQHESAPPATSHQARSPSPSVTNRAPFTPADPAGRQRLRAQSANLSALRRCSSPQPCYLVLICAGQSGLRVSGSGHLVITDLVQTNRNGAIGNDEYPGQGPHESPLTESNRRPSPYHRQPASPCDGRRAVELPRRGLGLAVASCGKHSLAGFCPPICPQVIFGVRAGGDGFQARLRISTLLSTGGRSMGVSRWERFYRPPTEPQ